MLPSQVGAIDLNRPGNRGVVSREPEVRMSRSHLRQILWIWLTSVLMCIVIVIAAPQVSGQSKGRKKKAGASAKAGGSPGEQSLTNIPLPIGHEAKGLVLPDFDLNGRLRGKFVAGSATRIDQERIGFRDLKITTFNEANQVDLEMEMATSTFDITTKILSTQERTTIRRTDFNI